MVKPEQIQEYARIQGHLDQIKEIIKWPDKKRDQIRKAKEK